MVEDPVYRSQIDDLLTAYAITFGHIMLPILLHLACTSEKTTTAPDNPLRLTFPMWSS